MRGADCGLPVAGDTVGEFARGRPRPGIPPTWTTHLAQTQADRPPMGFRQQYPLLPVPRMLQLAGITSILFSRSSPQTRMATITKCTQHCVIGEVEDRGEKENGPLRGRSQLAWRGYGLRRSQEQSINRPMAAASVLSSQGGQLQGTRVNVGSI
jgi:hypothetical protein